MSKQTAEELIKFIEMSPSSFHAIDTMSQELEAAGFRHLYEEEAWDFQAGGKYYVTRNGSSVIAFTIPSNEMKSFQIIASHSDSPTFKLKENPEIEVEKQFVKLNVEKYGGMLMAPWFDRPLSLAGRLLVQEEGKIVTHLVNVDRDLVMIPSLAIHMDRKANEGYVYNPQVDLLPLLGGAGTKGSLMKILGESAGVSPEAVLGMDIYLYNRTKGTIWGAEEEFVSSGRLDDLQCAFASLKALLASENQDHVMVHCVLDNEEVGSLTRQGAASTFLKDTLERIAGCLGKDREGYLRGIASSFMLSADNGHSVHPNYQDKTDASNRPYVNGGIVLKFNASQKYTTDGTSAAVFRSICNHANVPCQTYVNRSDIPGGSTLGNISNGQVSVHMADIGLPQLAMHSPYETSGVKDTEYLIEAARTFYSADIEILNGGIYKVNM